MYKNYKTLIKIISDTIKSDRDKKFIKTNIDFITNYFIYISKHIDKLLKIINQPIKHYKKNIDMIKKLGFSDVNAVKLINLNNNQTGGSDSIINNAINKKIDTIHNLILSIPKDILKLTSLSLKKLSDILNIDLSKTDDFKTHIDIVYLFLFITASIPIVGFISDFIIICKSFKSNKRFLAIITILTRFMSIFTLNLIDLGVLFKTFYLLDDYSYNNYRL